MIKLIPGGVMFSAMLEKADGMKEAAYIRCPFDAKEVFGKGRVKVKVILDGQEFRTSIARYGTKEQIMVLNKEMRAAAGNKKEGERIEITMTEDTEPRIMEVPAYIEKAFREHPEIWKTFRSMSYTHQKEYVLYIDEAKREETRLRRIEKAIDKLGGSLQKDI